jgi:hypothetical protein
VAVTAVAGCGPVRGWSGRGGGRAAGRAEEVQPFLLAVPGPRQVQGDVAAAVPGGAGGDGDQVPADGGGRAFAKGGLPRAPAARTRLCAMAATASQAAFAAHPRNHRSRRSEAEPHWYDSSYWGLTW